MQTHSQNHPEAASPAVLAGEGQSACSHSSEGAPPRKLSIMADTVALYASSLSYDMLVELLLRSLQLIPRLQQLRLRAWRLHIPNQILVCTEWPDDDDF